MRSWLVALRIAQREARRAKGRTALVVLMIALPVAALSFAAATYDMYRLTPGEQVTRQLGSADGYADWTSSYPVQVDGGPPVDAAAEVKGPHTAAALLANLPSGSRLSPYWNSTIDLNTATGFGSLGAMGVDLSDPMTTGLVHLTGGRLPRSAAEILASPSAMTRLGTHVGDVVKPTVIPGDPPEFALPAYTIVGTAEVAGSLNQYVVLDPSQLPNRRSWLVTEPAAITTAQVATLAHVGIQMVSRNLLLHQPADASPRSTTEVDGFSLFGIGTIVAGLGLFEVVLLAGPAFAVGARRRQRELALVATAGGTPSTLRRIVLADGIVGGITAAVVGLAGGLIVAVAGRPWLEVHLAHQRFGGYRIYPLAIGAVVLLAIVTGVLGALVPAFTAGRQDVVAALSGRRGVARSRPIWLVLGVIGIALGGVIAFAGAYQHGSNLVLAGLVIGEFGIVLCTPSIVALVSRAGRFLPVAPRMALRDTARRRAAAAPAISAVMAAVAGSIALAVYLGGASDREPALQPALPVGSISVMAINRQGIDSASSVPSIEAAIAKAVPGSRSTAVFTVDDSRWMILPTFPPAQRCPYADSAGLSSSDRKAAAADPRCGIAAARSQAISWISTVITDDPATLAVTMGLHGADLQRATAALRAGDVVTNKSAVLTGGTITVQTAKVDTDGSSSHPQSHTVPAIAINGDQTLVMAMEPATLAKLGATPKLFGVIATPPAMPTQAQTDALNAGLAKLGVLNADVETGPGHDNQTIAIILAIAAAVIALGAAAIATGLASVDGRADLRTLGAVGATPRVRRSLALSQSGVIAGLGSLLGAIAGLGAGAAVLFGLNRVYANTWPAPSPYPIEVPWLNLIVSLIAIPAVAMLGAGLFTRSRLPSERRAD